MTKKPFGVFICRCSPFHNGHASVIQAALEKVERLIIVIGSANQPRTIKNPWDTEERIQMISEALKPIEADFVALSDRPYANTIWLSDLQYKVGEITNYADDKDIGLIVCKTDITSNYLDEIPQWEALCFNIKAPIHATQIRERYFTYDKAYKEFLHPNVIAYLEEFRKTDDFKLLKEEFDFITDYKGQWLGAPFSPLFVCSDVVCVRSGHVLLVRRKHSPGKGLWALPGGHLAQQEFIIDGAIRELKEETSIGLSTAELKKAITENKVFDAPSRSLRGRTISHAFLCNLGSGKLDRVQPADDAAECKWVSVDEALSMEEVMFEDHYSILRFFINRA